MQLVQGISNPTLAGRVERVHAGLPVSWKSPWRLLSNMQAAIWRAQTAARADRTAIDHDLCQDFEDFSRPSTVLQGLVHLVCLQQEGVAPCASQTTLRLTKAYP